MEEMIAWLLDKKESNIKEIKEEMRSTQTKVDDKIRK
jgi:hypothetical protein